MGPIRRAAAVLALATLLAGPSVHAQGRIAVPAFIEETATSGIDHTYDGDWRFFVGGGVAAFDGDDDGRPELYVAGGENPAALYRNSSPGGGALAFEVDRARHWDS